MVCGFTVFHLIALLPSLLACNATSCMLNYNVQDQDTNQYNTVQQLCGGYYYDIYISILLVNIRLENNSRLQQNVKISTARASASTFRFRPGM